MSRPFAVVTLLGLLAASCGPSQLNQLRDVVMTVRTEVDLWVSLSATGTPQTGCAELSSAKATLNGVPMRQLTPGGSTNGPSLGAPQLSECVQPTFAADAFTPDGGLVEFVISDATATFTTSVQAPRTVRTLALSPDGGTLQRGASATASWPNANESLNPARTQVVLLTPDGGPRLVLVAGELEVSNGEVRFTVPTSVPRGDVHVVVTSERLALTHCEGPSSCVLDEAVGGAWGTVGP